MPHPLTPIRARWLFWLTLLIISTLAFMPSKDVPPISTGWDKSNHALAFFVLMVLAVLAWPRRTWWRLALAMVGYGVFIEVVQYFVGRDADAMDVVGDSVGILLQGALFYWAIRPSKSVTSPQQSFADDSLPIAEKTLEQ